ncbi:MAG: hypothetical protein Q8P13_04055 [bacterium]|nr:hypothetical protein [bacterium]
MPTAQESAYRERLKNSWCAVAAALTTHRSATVASPRTARQGSTVNPVSRRLTRISQKAGGEFSMETLRFPDDYDRMSLWLATTPDGRRIVEGKLEEFPNLFSEQFDQGLRELGFDSANLLRVKELALDWHRQGSSQRGRLSRIDVALLRAVEQQLSMSLVSPPLKVRLEKLSKELRQNSRKRRGQRTESLRGAGNIVIGPGC